MPTSVGVVGPYQFHEFSRLETGKVSDGNHTRPSLDRRHDHGAIEAEQMENVQQQGADIFPSEELDAAPPVEPGADDLGDLWVVLPIPLKVDAFVPILWGVMLVFTFAGREPRHALGENL